MGLSQALGMIAGCLAMWGGAKLDELTSKENMLNPSEKGKNSEKEERDYILRKARENVGSPLLNEGRQLGVVYSKGHLKPNMRRVEDSFERLDKKRKSGVGMGAKAGLLTATFIQGMTSNLDDVLTLKALGKGIGDITGSDKKNPNNYPYNVINYEQQQKDKGYDLFMEGIESLLGQLQGITLSSEGGSMSEGERSNAYNKNNVFSGSKPKDIENLSSPFRSINGYSNNYIEEIEKLNRNNIQRISERYMNFENVEAMVKKSVERYRDLK